jgi:hypothetical protein
MVVVGFVNIKQLQGIICVGVGVTVAVGVTVGVTGHWYNSKVSHPSESISLIITDVDVSNGGGTVN